MFQVFPAVIVIDGLLFLFLFTTISARSSAARSSLMWMLHCFTLVIKLIVLTVPNGKVFGEWNVALFLTTPIYGILMLRSALHLYSVDGSSLVCLESLIHSDLTFRVAADLFDIAFFFYFRTWSPVYTPPDKAIDVVIVGVSCAALILHAFSFPTSHSRKKDSSENDVLLTSKHVSLVSLFFVDIPLMTVRAVVWLRTPKTLALSPMVMKNICSSLYASTSLHRCRLLEKERDKLASSETTFKPVRESSSFRKQPMAQDIQSSEGPSDRTTLPAEIPEPTPATRDQFNSEDDFATRKQMKSKQLQSLVNDVKSVRELPVVAFRASGILRKAGQLSLFPTRMSLATYLDSTFCLEYWQQFRVVVPYFIWLGVRITLVFLTFLKVDGLQDPLDWLSNPLPTDYIIAFSLVGATMLLTFFCWVGFCPMLDVVCLVLFAGVRLLSYWLTLTTFRETRRTASSYILSSYQPDFFAIPGLSSGDINVEQLFFCFFALRDCMTLLMSLVPAHHGVLGKDFMYYSVIRTGMEDALPSAPGFAEPTGTQDIADEAGRVSTAAATLFINCRLGVAPSSIHSLIMGPNMIKSVRLNDLFATTAVWEIVMTFVLKLVTSILYLNVVHVVIFSLHVIGKLGYHIFASSVRCLALRRYEVKALFHEIVKRCSERDDDVDGIAHPKYISLNDYVKHFHTQGFFTSPGFLFTPHSL